MKNLQNYLFKLCGECLPSGFEREEKSVEALLAPLVDEVHKDSCGNIIGCRKSAFGNAKKIMLDAHLDEIGLMVTKIDDAGFIHFTNLAGFSPIALPASSVMVKGKRNLSGVVATLPPHLLSAEERKKPIEMKKMVIDVGYPAETVRELIKVGDPIILRQGCAELLNDRITGKALDNRAGVAVILDMLTTLQKMPLAMDLYVVFSAGEEFSGFGALNAAMEIAPDEAVVIDVTHGESGGTPRGKAFPLGCGAVIGVAPILSGAVTDRLKEMAKQYVIPYEMEPINGRTGTNSDQIATSRCGVPTGLVSIPLRYMHSGCEVADLKDLKAVSDLLSRYVNRGGARYE
ncbi:MAG: M28 family peptidase [Clostridia bacterium]|nr:M28 family peptidase [Clostridia bacterium]